MKKRRHWWLTVWKDTGSIRGTHTSRQKARDAKREAVLSKHIRVIKVRAESDIKRLADDRTRELLLKYVTAPDPTKINKVTLA